MKIPKMILFDYGQTLIAEQKFDGVKGTEAVLQYATRNKYHLSAEQVQAKATEINREFGIFEKQRYPHRRNQQYFLCFFCGCRTYQQTASGKCF